MAIEDSLYVLNKASNGITPGNMKKFNVSSADAELKLTFCEPDDTYIDGQLICTVQGCRILYKTTGYPEDENDGTLVYDTVESGGTIGQHENTAIVIDNLTNDIPYYFAAFPYSDNRYFNRNASAYNRKVGTPKSYVLYGYDWDTTDSNPATCITYAEMNEDFTPYHMDFTNGAPVYGDWNNADNWIFSGSRNFAVKTDMTIDYELNPNNLAQKVDGSASDVANTGYDGNMFTSRPLIWVKRWFENGIYHFRASNVQLDSDYIADAFTDESGNILSYTLLPTFPGTVINSKMRSISGFIPMNSYTSAQETTYATANGARYSKLSASVYMLELDLMFLFGKSTNTQVTYGYGNYTGGSSASNHVKGGTLNAMGKFFGYASTQNKPFKFLGVEYGHGAWIRPCGYNYNSSQILFKSKPPYNDAGTGYENLGFTIGGTSGGYISAINANKHGIFPKTVSGSDSTYLPDGCWFAAGTMVALVFGGCNDGLHCGGGAVGLSDAASVAHWSVSASLLLLPPVDSSLPES